MVKPKMAKDWDENRMVVWNQKGEKFVLFKPQALRLFNASMRLHKKKHKRDLALIK